MADGKVTLVLPGIKEEKPGRDAEVNEYLEVEVRASHRVDAAACGGSQSPKSERSTEAEASDIVEMEFENGVRRWVPVRFLHQEVRPFARKRGGEAESADPSEIEIPTTLAGLGDQHGPLKDFALKAVNVLRPLRLRRKRC
jgi:hypothetical protein